MALAGCYFTGGNMRPFNCCLGVTCLAEQGDALNELGATTHGLSGLFPPWSTDYPPVPLFPGTHQQWNSAFPQEERELRNSLRLSCSP